MSIFSTSRIALKQHAADKKDAVRKAGQLLTHSGCVLLENMDDLFTREVVLTSSLGHGVAILHGNHDNEDHCISTGISVLQLAEGVKWDDKNGEVNLIIGIAAKPNELGGVLANLKQIIKDDVILAELLFTSDLGKAMNCLNVELLYTD